MPLKSAFEDLLETTLASVAGLLGKFAYLASLRKTASGGYSHWGFSKVYGEEGTQRALSEAHRSLFLQLLRTPLRTLWQDAGVSSTAAEASPHDYLESLRDRLPSLLPQDLGGGSARHLSSVLHALSTLTSQQKDSPPGATPLA